MTDVTDRLEKRSLWQKDDIRASALCKNYGWRACVSVLVPS